MEKNKELPVGVNLRHTSNAIKRYINNYLSMNLNLNLTGIEGMTLMYIFRKNDKVLTAQDIISEFKVSKATSSQTLNNLVQKGYISMNPSKEDRRMKLISLTKLGQETNNCVDKAFLEITKVIIAGLNQQQLDDLETILSIIKKNVGYYSPNGHEE